MASIQWEKLPFNFVTPSEILAAGFVLPIVCASLVLIRLYIRKLQRAKLGPDDWFIILGVIFTAGMSACLITGERLRVMGYPTPVPDGTTASQAFNLFLDSYILVARLQFALQFLMAFSYGFVKLSFIFFCRRIFFVCRGSPFDWASIVMIVITTIWSVGFLMALIFGCGKDVAIHWSPLGVLGETGCDAITPEKAVVISDPILDLLILLLPLPTIWRMSNLSVGRKLAVTGVFMVGLMAWACSLARMAIYLTVLYQGYGAGYDLDQTVTTMLWWSTLEVALAAIAANLPTLSFLARDGRLQKFFSRLYSGPLSTISMFRSTGTGSASDSGSRSKQESSPSRESSSNPVYVQTNREGDFSV